MIVCTAGLQPLEVHEVQYVRGDQGRVEIGIGGGEHDRRIVRGKAGIRVDRQAMQVEAAVLVERVERIDAGAGKGIFDLARAIVQMVGRATRICDGVPHPGIVQAEVQVGRYRCGDITDAIAGVGIEADRIRPAPGGLDQGVGAPPRGEHVVVIPAQDHQGIVARTAVEHIVAIIAGDGIVGVAAGHILDIGNIGEAGGSIRTEIDGNGGGIGRHRVGNPAQTAIVDQVGRATASIDDGLGPHRVTLVQLCAIREVEGVVIMPADQVLDGVAILDDAVGDIQVHVQITVRDSQLARENIEAQPIGDAGEVHRIDGAIRAAVGQVVDLAPVRVEEPGVVASIAIQRNIHVRLGRGNEEGIVPIAAVGGQSARRGGVHAEVEGILSVIPVENDRIDHIVNVEGIIPGICVDDRRTV